MEILTATMWFNSAGIMALMWLALVILFAVIEFISLGLTSIWFAAGAFVAGIVAMLGGAFWLQIVVFIVVSAVLLACTRKFAKKYLDSKIEKTNVESLIGKTSVVIETINNMASTGKIRIGDVEWTARTAEGSQVIAEGSKVVIREIVGVKCIVEPINEEIEAGETIETKKAKETGA